MAERKGFPTTEGLLDQQQERIKIVSGQKDTPPSRKDRWTESTARLEDIDAAAAWIQQALLTQTGPARCTGVNSAIYKRTWEERDLGWAVGAFSPDDVAKRFGKNWDGARRFGVVQGEDYRPIDACSGHGHKTTSGTVESI